MSLTYYENIMKRKRANTPFREFVKEIGSWWPITLHKVNKNLSRYPETSRKGLVVRLEEFPPTWNDVMKEDIPLKDSTFLKDLTNLIAFSTKPATNRFYGANENAEFCDNIFGVKNCYLSTAVGGGSENILYSGVITDSHDVFNSVSIFSSSNVHYGHHITKSYNVFYSCSILNSHDIWFSANLIGCYECILCEGLENKSYCIKNQEFSKEEYFSKKNEICKKISYSHIFSLIQKISLKNINSINITGTGITNSENIENGKYIDRLINGRNVMLISGGNGCINFYDVIEAGTNCDGFYGVGGSGTDSSNIFLSVQIGKSMSIYYSYIMESCHHCLGCIGLKNKSYCILNTQYTKEEWEKKACEIFAAMERDGTLGSFFPASMNPFYFNDTMAYLIDPSFTKEEVEKEGYMWRDESIKVDIPEGLEVVKSSELDRFQGWISHSELDSKSSTSSQSSQNQKKLLKPVQDDEHTVWYIDPDILRKVIVDEKGNYYRIIKMEYDFLMKHALPLPEIHWLDRMKMGFQMGI